MGVIFFMNAGKLSLSFYDCPFLSMKVIFPEAGKLSLAGKIEMFLFVPSYSTQPQKTTKWQINTRME